jgi:hypothetical protein
LDLPLLRQQSEILRHPLDLNLIINVEALVEHHSEHPCFILFFELSFQVVRDPQTVDECLFDAKEGSEKVFDVHLLVLVLDHLKQLYCKVSKLLIIADVPHLDQDVKTLLDGNVGLGVELESLVFQSLDHLLLDAVGQNNILLHNVRLLVLNVLFVFDL